MLWVLEGFTNYKSGRPAAPLSRMCSIERVLQEWEGPRPIGCSVIGFFKKIIFWNVKKEISPGLEDFSLDVCSVDGGINEKIKNKKFLNFPQRTLIEIGVIREMGGITKLSNVNIVDSKSLGH